VSGQKDHERQLILSFILPERQSRYLELLGKPERRDDITSALAHFKHLDMRSAVEIPSHRQHVLNIVQMLKAKGAPGTCYALSEDDELDGKETALQDALKSVVGYGTGTFLSSVSGRLGYFENEEGRWTLERKPGV
jgi:hypothetical protein